MLRLRKRGPPLVAPEHAQSYRDLVVSGFTAWRPTIGDAFAASLGRRAARRLLGTSPLDPALQPAQVPFDAWLRLHAAFIRMPGALRDRVGGAEARLRAQQAHLRREHRSRAPRDALGSSPDMAHGRDGRSRRQPGPTANSTRRGRTAVADHG
jgi:hypothetical protein